MEMITYTVKLSNGKITYSEPTLIQWETGEKNGK